MSIEKCEKCYYRTEVELLSKIKKNREKNLKFLNPYAHV